MSERALRKQLASFNAVHLDGPKPKIKKARKKAQARDAAKKEKKDSTEKNLHLIEVLETSKLAQAKHSVTKEVRSVATIA